MLKTMLFSGIYGSGSGSWVLQFNEEGLILNNICIDENGPLYVAGEAYRYFSTNSKVKNVFSARIENTGTVSWQNYFGDNTDNESKQSENGHIAIVYGNIMVGGNEIVNNSLVGTQLCLYSVNGEKLDTRKIYGQKTGFGSISDIKSFYNYVFIYGDYSAQARVSDNSIYLYDMTNHSPNKIVDMTIADYQYFCVQDKYSGSFISRTGNPSAGISGYTHNIYKAGTDAKIEVTGICVNSQIFICGTTNEYKYIRGIVAKHSDSYGIDQHWVKEISSNAHVYCRGISLDTDKNSYIVGDSSGLGFLIKLSSYGNVLLNIKITGDEYTVKSVKVDTKGNVYLLMPKHVVKLTKDDIESAITSPLSIGPLTFTRGSLNISSGQTTVGNKSLTRADSNTYNDTSSAFISREANLTSNLYKG